jgi:hypothetical protein
MFGSFSPAKSRVLIAVVSAGLALCLAEYGSRWGLAHSPAEWLGDPGHYFDPLCDEDYWRALRRGAYGADLHRVGPNEQHSRLGWIPARTSLDTNGALRSLSSVESEGSTVALFGDSYVFGTTEEGHRVSDHLRTLRPNTAVLNFGVGGYGLGQILLRLEDRVSVLKPGDTAVMGVLTTDIDRAILGVRDAPKPRFELSIAGELVEHEPASGDVASWFDAHPIQASMLLWHRLERTWALHQAADRPSTQPSCREEDKTNLARALMSRMGEVCTENALRCHVLALYRPIDLQHGAGWRRTVLTEDHGLEVLDSWAWFQGEENVWQGSYGADQHPNSRGNARIARGVNDAIEVP